MVKFDTVQYIATNTSTCSTFRICDNSSQSFKTNSQTTANSKFYNRKQGVHCNGIMDC